MTRNFLTAGLLIGAIAAVDLGCGGRETLEPTAVFSADPISLGSAPCAGEGDPFAWSLSSAASAGTLHYSATTEGPFSLVGSAQGSLEPGRSVSLGVRAKVPRAAARLATVTGALIVVTDDPTHREIRIPLSAVASGAELYIADPADLGEVPLGGELDLPLRIENKGDEAVGVDFGAPDVATFKTKVASTTSAPHTSNLDVTFRFGPVSLGAVETTVPVTYRGHVCGDPPATVRLRARGVAGLAVSPGLMNFGLVDCGSTASPLAITMSTSTATPVKFTVSQKNTAAFLVGETSGTVNPNEVHTVWVTPSPVPSTSSTAPNAIGDVITVTTDIPGDYAHVVTVAQTAYGAVLAMPAKTAAGRALIDASSTATLTLPLSNSGNAPALVSGSTAGSTATFSQMSVPAGVTVNATISLHPNPTRIGRPDSGTIAYSVTGPNCGLDAPEITMTPYDIAVDVDYPQSGGGCIAGHSGKVYCTGSGLTFVVSSSPPLVTYVPEIVGTRVFFGNVQDACAVQGSVIHCIFPSTPVTMPSGSSNFRYSRGAALRLCVTDAVGQLLCSGSNEFYQFGNGTHISPPWTQWEPAMTGLSGIAEFDGQTTNTFAVSNGKVYGTGYDTYGFLRTGSTSTLAAFPLELTELTNVSRVAVSDFGAAALHVDGTVTHWTGSTLAPVPGITDAVALAEYGGGVCVLRQNGAVRCVGYKNPPVWDLVNIVTPIQKVTPFAALEANGAVTGWDGTYPNTYRFAGFEGP